LERIIRLFNSEGVEYIIIGGQAQFFFGSDRQTLDFDACYERSPANLKKIAKCLSVLNARLRGFPEGLPFAIDEHSLSLGCNFTFRTDAGDIDLLGVVEPIGGFREVLANHERYSIGDEVVRTISLDDLLRVKLHINRPKDQLAIIDLQGMKKAREKQL
jgi:hypothetical protein